VAVYCGVCARQRDLPRSALRVATEPCQFCNGYESQQVRRHVGRPGVNRRAVTQTVQLNNFDYPDKLINSMPGSFEKVAEREYRDVDLGS
jgi:hypothetical protein